MPDLTKLQGHTEVKLALFWLLGVLTAITTAAYWRAIDNFDNQIQFDQLRIHVQVLEQEEASRGLAPPQAEMGSDGE